MHGLVITVGIANSILLVLLAGVATRRWRVRRDAAVAWLAIAFMAMAALVTVGRLVPSHPHGFLEYLGQRLDIEVLVLLGADPLVDFPDTDLARRALPAEPPSAMSGRL